MRDDGTTIAQQTPRRPADVPSLLEPTPAEVAIRARHAVGVWSLPEVRWAAIAIVLFVVALGFRLLGAPGWISDGVFLACYGAGGWQPGVAGLRALRDKSLDVDLLMIVAAVGAAGIGQFFDGGLLIVIFATSGAQEAYATKRTQDSVRALLNLAPEQANRLGADGSKTPVNTADLTVADVIVVRPGESIGADGDVIFGASEVDQASITGEPLPVFRGVGDPVFAGTLNGDGVLHIEVTRSPADFVVARIVSMVEQASATKAKTQLFIDKVEQRYSFGVVVTTLAVFVVPLAFGGALHPTLLRAMTYMIVASPCAVVLATMPPLLSAIANAGRHGVLVKSAIVMEQLATTTHVAFDKTGTLTTGTPRVAEIVPAADVNDIEVLVLAAAAERSSEHPLARAIIDAATTRHLHIPPAADFTSTPGRGVTARVNGQTVRVGSPVLLDRCGRDPVEVRAAAAALEAQGRTVVVVLADNKPIGLLALADHLRPNAKQVVAALTTLTGNPPVLLTGDNAGAAAQVGTEVGITDVRARLLPHDKVSEVAAMRGAGYQVIVVGDGVNDAPALAAADLGIAMGRHGSDLALQTADAIIVRDELTTLPAVIALSRSARRAVVQNLVFAGAAIVGLICWDLLGHLPLPLGVAGHEGGTVLVGLNGLRLLRRRAWHSHTG